MRLPRKQLIALLALLQLAQMRTAARSTAVEVDLLEGLTAGQLEYVASDADRRVLTGGRRSGKTEAIVVEMVAIAAKGGRALYLSLTRLLAEETIWDRLLARLDAVGIAYRVNLTKLRIKLVSGGLIQLGGTHTSADIDKHRGMAWNLVAVDECGAQPSELLRYLVEASIGPTLLDHEGRLTLLGTPSPLLSGFWADQAGLTRVSDCPRWEWTIYDNPFFAGREDRVLAAIRHVNAWSEDSITYRREYLGRWVQDAGVLVYPFELARNGLDRLPQVTPSGYPVPPDGWRFVIAVDVGTTLNAMAIVVWAAHLALPDEYIVHAEAHTKMLMGALKDRLRILGDRYPHAQKVLDAGGMGAAHALELTGHFAMHIIPAEKREKPSAIRVMRDRVLAGRVKVLNFPALDGLREEWGRLGWDKDHLQHHPSQADHYSDASLYGLRNLRNWRTDESDAKPAPAPGSAEEMAAVEAEMERAETEAVERQELDRGRDKGALWH